MTILVGQIGCFNGPILALTLKRHKGPSAPQGQLTQLRLKDPAPHWTLALFNTRLTFSVAPTRARPCPCTQPRATAFQQAANMEH